MPSDAPSSTPLQCPQCGGGWRAGSTRCWLCGADVEPVAVDTAATLLAEKPEPLGTFSLASLMTFVTLVAVVCGTFTIAPGLGILAAIVAVLAFVRTVILVHRQSDVGRRFNAVQQVVLFAGSLAVVMLTGTAAAIAFFATCLGGGFSLLTALSMTGVDAYYQLMFGGVAGSVVGGVVGVYLGYRVYMRLSKREPRLSRRGKLILLGAMILLIIAFILFWLNALWTEYPKGL